MSGMPAAAPVADPIGSAIAAVEDQPVTVELRQVQGLIASTGRPVVVAMPVDVSDIEIAEIAGWLLTAVTAAHRKERAAGGLLVARAMPVAPLKAGQR